MTQPTSCLRCKGTELASAAFECTGAPRLVVDASHASPIAARICLMCGAVMLTATEPGALRVREAPHREVQEYDF